MPNSTLVCLVVALAAGLAGFGGFALAGTAKANLAILMLPSPRPPPFGAVGGA